MESVCRVVLVVFWDTLLPSEFSNSSGTLKERTLADEWQSLKEEQLYCHWHYKFKCMKVMVNQLTLFNDQSSHILMLNRLRVIFLGGLLSLQFFYIPFYFLFWWKGALIWKHKSILLDIFERQALWIFYLSFGLFCLAYLIFLEFEISFGREHQVAGWH